MDIRPERRYRIEVGAPELLDITLAGCGGTGSFVALHLARLAYHLRDKGGPDVHLALVDPDLVEAGNIGRQNFCPAEIGASKAAALMERYNRAFGLEIEACQARIGLSHLRTGSRAVFSLVIGCVDNAAARRDMAKAVDICQGRLWWLDGGNHAHAGQVLLGNRAGLAAPEISKLGFCAGLPSPATQCPDLLTDDGRGDVSSPSCAELAALDVQSLMVNQAVAGWLAAYVYRLLVAKDLDMMATYFDLLSGSARSEYITAPDISGEITAAEER